MGVESGRERERERAKPKNNEDEKKIGQWLLATLSLSPFYYSSFGKRKNYHHPPQLLLLGGCPQVAFLGEKRLVFFARKERERRIYPGKGKTRKGQRINCPLKPCIGYKNGKNKLERDCFIEAPLPQKYAAFGEINVDQPMRYRQNGRFSSLLKIAGGNSCESRGKRRGRGVFLNGKKGEKGQGTREGTT